MLWVPDHLLTACMGKIIVCHFSCIAHENSMASGSPIDFVIPKFSGKIMKFKEA